MDNEIVQTHFTTVLPIKYSNLHFLCGLDLIVHDHVNLDVQYSV